MKFSRYFGRSPDKLGLEDVRAFQVYLVSQGIARPALNQTVCALRFFYGVTLDRAEIPEHIVYARMPRKLPAILSADEVVRFLEAVPSPKARTALTMAYPLLDLEHDHQTDHLGRGVKIAKGRGRFGSGFAARPRPLPAIPATLLHPSDSTRVANKYICFDRILAALVLATEQPSVADGQSGELRTATSVHLMPPAGKAARKKVTMEPRILGSRGLAVSPIGLGCMGLTRLIRMGPLRRTLRAC